MHNLSVSFFGTLFIALSFIKTKKYIHRGNTEGWRCERCKSGYWGDPLRGCELCNCHQLGSVSNVCDVVNGQCLCQPRYGGHHCDECEVSIRW